MHPTPTTTRCAALLIRSSLLALLALTGVDAATYYVDSGAGSDADAGTSAATPWRSLAKASAAALLPGDRVLFKRGAAWSGSLRIARSGVAGDPIYFGSYGDPALAKPTLNGGGAAATVLVAGDTSYVTIEGFAITDFDGADVFDGAEAVRCGIKAGEWGGTDRGITIRGNEVFFIEGCSNHPAVGSPRGTTLDPGSNHQYANAAIYPNSSTSYGMLIDGNTVHDCTCAGIIAFAFTRSYGLVIQDNIVDNVGADGIYTSGATSPVVQFNTCRHAGNNSGTRARAAGELGFNGLAVAGMWCYASSDALFQGNCCEGTRKIAYDGQAWDFDIGCTGTCVFQYNLSRDNEGGFVLVAGSDTPGLTRICRYNISIDDGAKQGVDGEGFFNGDVTYADNLFYRDDGRGFLISGAAPMFFDNIFATTATSDITYQTGGRVFANNCFTGHAPIAPGSAAILADPRFVDAATARGAHAIDGVSGFQLLAASPCRDAGVAVANGGRDFWGDALTDGRSDVGPYELPSAVAPSIVAQPADAAATAGQPATFTVAAVGTAPLAYQWRRGGAAIPGATGASYTTPPTTLADDGAAFSVVVGDPAGSVTSGVATLTVTSPVPTRSPFGGTPRPVPGTIQAEDFDDGGEGIAYHDSDVGNDGGAYRATDVDIRACVDVGGGYQVGWFGSGEWLEYSVNVATSGGYDIAVRVANGASGGTIHVAVDGVDRTGPLAFAATGGWDAWTTVTASDATLTSGAHIVRLSCDAGALDCNWLAFTPSAGGVVAGQVYQLVAKHSGKCLDVDQVSTVAGANVQQWTNWGGPNQQWRIDAVADGSYTLTSVNSGMVLDVAGESTADGGNVIQWPAHDGANQHWRIEADPVGSGWYRLACVDSGKVLDVAGVSAADGANVQQWTDWGGANQRWALVPVAPTGTARRARAPGADALTEALAWTGAIPAARAPIDLLARRP